MKLVLGEAVTEPQINVWLETTKDGFMLVLKHSEDSSDQRLFSFSWHKCKIVVEMQELCTPKLCTAFGIETKQTPPILPWLSGHDATVRLEGKV